jgi:zinc protease
MNGARRFIFAAVAAAAALAWLPGGAQAQRSELEKLIRRKVLANGLEVIVVESHGVPLATVEIDVRNGAFTQPPEYAGLAHMYEHMFFKASRDYSDPEGFVNRASALGAIFNGTTSEERVNYYMTVPADSVRGALQLVAASVRAPLFRQDELERERQVVLGEYDRNESSPGFEFQNEMTKRLYPGQYSRKNTIGDREVIRTVTPDKMRVIQKKYYVPNNSALVVTGDVTPDSVFKYAEQYYGQWARGADPFAADPVPPIAPLTKDDALVSEAPVSAVLVMLQWQGPSVRRDPGSTYAADVFSDALNSPSSAFQQRLVDSGLFQGVTVNYYTLNQAGPITISAQTTPDKLKEGMAALEAEVQKLDDPGYFSGRELVDVKAQRATETAFGIERASGLTHTVGFWWSVADLEYFMGYVDNMAKQTPADLQRYAQRYIVGKPRVSGVLISPADRQALNLSAADLLRVGTQKVQP